MGRGAAEEVVRARAAGGPFKDLFDFCERLDPKAANRAALEKLIKAGAFDCLGLHRSLALHLLPRAMQAASERQNDRRLGQGNLFDAAATPDAPAETPGTPAPLLEVEPWSEAEKLKHEKEVLDFYLSSHPLAHMEKDLRRFTSYSVEHLRDLPDDHEVTLGGMLTQVRYMNTKKARNGNTRFVRCKLEDVTGTVDCIMWPDDLVRYKDEVREDRICFVRGKVDRKRDEPSLVLSRILSLEQAQRELARALWLLFEVGRHSPVDVDAIAQVLRRTPGGCPVNLTVRDAAGKKCALKLSRDFSVNPNTYLKDELEDILGSGCVKLM